MNCEHCKQHIPESVNPHASIAPIVVMIESNPEIGPNDVKLGFCCWECAAMWFNAQAGEILMSDLDHEYWQEQIRS
jgi:hypothetical protein